MLLNCLLFFAELWGCFTWAQLPAGVCISDAAWHAAQPALSNADFSERQRALRGAIVGIQAQALAFEELKC